MTLDQLVENYNRNRRFVAAFVRQGKYDLVAEVAAELVNQGKRIAEMSAQDCEEA